MTTLKRPKKGAPEDSASTKDKILEAARLEFAEHGIKAAKIAVICRRANIANGTFYLHFRTKEDVWAELLQQSVEELASRLRDSEIAESVDARTRDRMEVSIIVRFAEEREDLFTLILGERSGQIAAHDLFLKGLNDQRRDAIQAGIVAGQFRANLHPTITALADFGVTTEVVQWWQKNPGSMSREELIEYLVDLRARMFFPD